jgi:hypothetical protein
MNLLLVRIRQELERAAAARALLITTVAGIFLALLGPLGTDAAPLWGRLIYWLSLAEIGAVLGVATTMALRRLLDPDERRPFAIACLTAVAITLPLSVAAFEITTRFFQPDGRGRGMRPGGDLLGFIAPVLVISLGLSLINALAHRPPVHTRAASPGAPPPRFDDRLPAHLKGAEVYAVEAEDHYLRLHTSRGSSLILMRLSDAIAELEGVEGAQTHRSWWVARKAVKGARRVHARAILELPGGVEAPVSRTHASALRAEGWF